NNLSLLVSCKNTIPFYTVKDYSLVAFKNSEEIDKVLLPQLNPKDSIQIQVTKADEIQILRPGGFDCRTLRIE
ncbi:MAG: hypothetical protein ABFS38_07380, partial [Bacteroidota bacterium]